MTRWLELAVEADTEAIEAVSEILNRVAPGGVSVEPAFELVDDGLGSRVDPSRPAMVRAFVPAANAAAGETTAAIATVDEALGHLRAFGLRPIGDLRTRLVDEADWADAWKAHFPVLRVGRRVVVRPTWRDHEPAPGEVVVAIDPGMAFGTGLHPTTRLCLAGLEELADDGALGAPAAVAGGRDAGGFGNARVLDVGCGSGILSIAALRLGAASVLGLDVDPIAIEATAANAARNGVEARVAARPGSVPSGEPPFDLVVANLIAGVLVELARPLAAEVAEGGSWLVSGIFRDREPEVRAAFAAVGLLADRRWAEEDWVALAGRGGPRP